MSSIGPKDWSVPRVVWVVGAAVEGDAWSGRGRLLAAGASTPELDLVDRQLVKTAAIDHFGGPGRHDLDRHLGCSDRWCGHGMWSTVVVGELTEEREIWLIIRHDLDASNPVVASERLVVLNVDELDLFELNGALQTPQ